MASAQSERKRVAVQVKVAGEAGMNKSVQPEQHGVRGALHGLVLSVWVQRFRWWGGGTSGQRDGQGQIPEDHAGMPKNWNLKLGVKGSHGRVFTLGRSAVRFTFWIPHSGSQGKGWDPEAAGDSKRRGRSETEPGLILIGFSESGTGRRIWKYSQVGAWVTARWSSTGLRGGWAGEDNLSSFSGASQC